MAMDPPEAAAEIAQLCAGLPLALRIVAALLADTPKRPLASLAHALAAEHSRMDLLRREDRGVRAAFDLSYQHLDPDRARLFRLLPLNPGPDFSTEAAAQLAGATPQQTEELLQDVARAHLIEQGYTWGRWRLHDLVRLYANQQGDTKADIDQREAARTRLFSYYRDAAEAADTRLQSPPGRPSRRFPSLRSALAWFDEESPNLVATTTMASSTGHPDTAIALASALIGFLNYRRSFDDFIAVISTALAIFREFGDRHGEARALNNLGTALREVHRFDDAIDAHTQALTIYRELGDRHHEGRALNNLGAALQQVHRFDDAIDAHTHALTIYRELGDRHGEDSALKNLDTARRQVHKPDG
jgi:tetratricopeptide (TPR) repeat protein